MTRYTEGFSHFVTSMTAPVASGWSDARIGLAPTGKAPPYHGTHPEQTFVGLDDFQGGILSVLTDLAQTDNPLDRVYDY